ncbi:serine/threonine-protein kinase S6KL [Thrips palmi]|uniref:Serine/threonine-protein kinase S6KL n=1 Tax=Thrips palmi TaxID=161013 RepID=A0A6P8YTS4_THRPL|nr:serine/threonine-protein kinase S6KL [Thrips palmi]
MGNLNEKSISCYGHSRGDIYRQRQDLSQFSLASFVNNWSGRSYISGTSQHSSYSVSRPWSRVSRRRWKESTLSNPYHIAKATWPVPYIEAVFLPEFKIKGPITESSFQVLKPLSYGAFGQVFHVKKIDTGDDYAMKILSKSKIISESAVQQVKDEARIQSTCGHNPFIVNCPFYWQSRKQLFIVSDYISGGELLDLCRSCITLPETLVQIYVAELALALDFLHNAGVIYRDLKLENILLDSDGHCQLIDFGLAKWLRYGDRTNTICGTLQYIAPEVLSREPYGHAADWWSLGVLACCMLCGQFPESVVAAAAAVALAGDEAGDVPADGHGGHDGEPRPSPRPSASASAGRPPDALQRCSAAARDMVARLLDRDPRRRLRTLHSLQTIAFYLNFSFADVRARKVHPRDLFENLLEVRRQKTEDVDAPFQDFDSIVPTIV